MCYETHKYYLHQTRKNYEINGILRERSHRCSSMFLNMQLTTGTAYTYIYIYMYVFYLYTLYIYIYIKYSSRNYDFLLFFIYILFDVRFYKANCHILILHLLEQRCELFYIWARPFNTHSIATV